MSLDIPNTAEPGEELSVVVTTPASHASAIGIIKMTGVTILFSLEADGCPLSLRTVLCLHDYGFFKTTWQVKICDP
jgi:TusA-related sulfurtransferase